MNHLAPYLFLAACLWVGLTDQQTPRSAPQPPVARTRPAVLETPPAQPAERRVADPEVREAEQRVTLVAARPTPDCQCQPCDCDVCHCKPGYKCDSNSCTLIPTPQHEQPAPRAPQPETSGIHWVTKAEAEASPKPDWWHVTAANLSDCHWCVVAERLLQSPEVVRASRQFDCVRSTRVSGRSVPYPTDVFVSPTRYWLVSGCPPTAAAYAKRLYDCLGIVNPPTLAAPPAETPKDPAEQPAQRSVLTRSRLLPTLGPRAWQPPRLRR